MFAGWGSWVARFRWPVLSVALVAVIGAGIWGLGVFGQLTEGGYNDPNSESTHASQTVQDAFGARGGDLVVIYTPANGKIDDPALGKRIRDRLAALPPSAVAKSTSYWNQKSSQYVAKDKSSAIAVITLAGDDDDAKLDSYREIDDKFTVDGATAQLSGAVALADASSTRSTSDLGTAELISLPITLILLVFLFGSLVAASLPVLVGGAAVLGSLGVLHLIASFHEVNSFAVNVASLLGLGMAIDYGLFMVGRFREEQAAGRTPAEAVSRTVGTAGRTVVFSATLLMIALAGLLLFPQGYLNSLAYGGLAAVFFAAVLSLTLLPALLAALGKRVDKLPVHLPRRAKPNPVSGWTRLAGFVLRRPLLVAVPILAALVLLASPIHSVKFGDSDERTLPASDPSRQAIETLKADYPQFSGNGVQIVLRGGSDTSAFAVAARQIPGIAQLSAAERANGVTLFTATLKNPDPYSTEARDIVSAIRALPVPRGAELQVGGTTARNVDSLEATSDRLPLMIVLLVGATLLLMFLAFGSILLPIKAVLVSALSLSATFGVLVWIFQQGHGSDLLNVTPAPLEVGIVVLMAAVVFGLSTDYEVFLLSRMVEARTRGASTAEAVTTGLTRTGRVISAAAALLIVVTGAFGLSSVTTMRFVGVGMIVALVLDATIVRMLLVPAVLSLLGDAAWWAPGPLRRLQQWARLSEYAGDEATPAAALPGRHSAPDDTATRPGLAGRRAALALPPGPVAEGRGEALALPAAAVPLALPAGPGEVTAMIPRIRDEEPAGAPAAPSPAGAPSPAPALASAAGSSDISEMSDGRQTSEAEDSDLPAFGRAVADRPGLYSAAAAPVQPAGDTTDWSAPDEFFFAPSGKAIEVPATEPPKPWERPALAAVPLPPALPPADAPPAAARDDAGRDISDFESTRDLTAAASRSTDPQTIRMVAPNLDVTGRMEAADVEATGVIPAPQAAPETVSSPTPAPAPAPAPAEAPRSASLADTPPAPSYADTPRPATPVDAPRPATPVDAPRPATPADAPRPTTLEPVRSFERTFEAPSAEPAMADLEDRLNRIFDRPAPEPIAPVLPRPSRKRPVSPAPAASTPAAPAAAAGAAGAQAQASASASAATPAAAPEQAIPAPAATTSPFASPAHPAPTPPVTTPPTLAPAASAAAAQSPDGASAGAGQAPAGASASQTPTAASTSAWGAASAPAASAAAASASATPPPAAPTAPEQMAPAAAADTPPFAEPVLPEPVGRAPGIAAPYVSAHVSAPTRPATDSTPTFEPAFDTPADHQQAGGLSHRLSNLSGGFRRTDRNEIPAQRRPSDLSDLQQRPTDLAALQNADRGIPGWGRSDDQPRRRPATLADRPALPAKATGGEPETELTHRPADLRDHLRATRPADLGQYTHNQKPEPPRRPATLADHIPEQRHAPDDEIR
ncbi:MMPL family transporter [Actinoplanes sp. TBRC 11911]|uniref:MMPL family transporter n=1 Tax=Actinoplanes sp. TBRC 11911 TaxID=2729386 RepID=UPI0028A208C5|nr:MMPL family transporter [Actinoplanes sp. TBRC 11911]